MIIDNGAQTRMAIINLLENEISACRIDLVGDGLHDERDVRCRIIACNIYAQLAEKADRHDLAKEFGLMKLRYQELLRCKSAT